MYAIPTEEDLVQVKEFIDILAHYGFGQWEEDYSYYNWLKDNNDYLADNYGFTFHDGCTKAVVVNEDFQKWVIKINLGCGAGPNGYDSYCGEEALNWINAINEGFERYFAATYFVEIKNGIEFFIQEYAENDESTYDSLCFSYYRSNSEKSEEEDEYDCYSDYWDMSDEERLYAIYGCQNNTHELVDFCWSNHINDLHCGNFGETKDGRTVIFDYSGY